MNDGFQLDLARVRALEAALGGAVEGRVPGQWRSLPDPRRLTGGDWPLLTVPAKDPGFGDLVVKLHRDQGYRVQVGRFGERELDRSEEPDPEALARRAADFAARVLRDEVVGHEGVGGVGFRARSEPEGWLTRMLRRGPLRVWSGPLI